MIVMDADQHIISCSHSQSLPNDKAKDTLGQLGAYPLPLAEDASIKKTITTPQASHFLQCANFRLIDPCKQGTGTHA
jgi:hypothetical protein